MINFKCTFLFSDLATSCHNLKPIITMLLSSFRLLSFLVILIQHGTSLESFDAASVMDYKSLARDNWSNNTLKVSDVAPTFVLPLGDSITQGSSVPGGYRGYLYEHLVELGYNPIFIGSKKKNCYSCENIATRYYEAHGAKKIDYFEKNLDHWMEGYPSNPDVILVLLGTTEFGNYVTDDEENAIHKFDSFLDRLTTLQPHAHIIVSNLLPRAPFLDEDIQKFFNPYVPDVASKYARAGYKVSFIDLRSKVPYELIADRVHPNKEGYKIIAKAWASAIDLDRKPNGDNFTPRVLFAIAKSSRKVIISFSKPISEDSIRVPENISFIENVSINGIKTDYTKRKIKLEISNLSTQKIYHVKIRGITDRTPTKRKIRTTTLALQFQESRPTEQPTESPTSRPSASKECVDKTGKFLNFQGLKRECVDLDKDIKLKKNCGTAQFKQSDLGKACPWTCRNFNDCKIKIFTMPSVQANVSSTIEAYSKSASTVCKNTNKSFAVNKTTKTCKNVKRNRKLCRFTSASEICPLLCNNCPCDNKIDTNDFIYVPLIESRRDCSFVRLNSEFYCGDKWNIFTNNCERTCGSCRSSAPTSKPTDMPTLSPSLKPSVAPCIDSTDIFFSKDYGTKRCRFYKRNPDAKDIMCKKPWVQELCRKTCGACHTYSPTFTPSSLPTLSPTLSPTHVPYFKPTTAPTVCEDSRDKFFVKGGLNDYRYCSDFDHNPDKYCQFDVYVNNCPATCGMCPNRNMKKPHFEPSSAPTNCADNPEQFFIKGKLNDYRLCSDFSFNFDKFCQYEDFITNCPASCGLCS